MFVYLDNGATTKQSEPVTEMMLRCVEENYGNPSSLHEMGLRAESAVKAARKSFGDAIEGAGGGICFTSGGTEAVNLALFGVAEARKRRGNKIITTLVEHPAVLESCKRLAGLGYEVVYAGVDGKCRLDMEELAGHIDGNTILISVMQVNNETGAIMPAREINALKKQDVLFHMDAAQAFGKIPVTAGMADLISVSGHKFHGPKGTGALFIGKGLRVAPMLYGGGQENNLRSGTENVPGIAGFGRAAQIAALERKNWAGKMSDARRYLLDGVLAEIPDVRINSPEGVSIEGAGGLCSPAILNISFLGTIGEVIMRGLEREGVFVSTGAACSSKNKAGSHVLAAMGLGKKEIDAAIRFSFHGSHTIPEMDYALCKLKREVSRFRKKGDHRQ